MKYPYYDSEKKLKSEKDAENLIKGLLIVFVFVVILIIIFN